MKNLKREREEKNSVGAAASRCSRQERTNMQLKASAAHHAALQWCWVQAVQPVLCTLVTHRTKDAKTFSGDIDQHSGGGRPPAMWPRSTMSPHDVAAAGPVPALKVKQPLEHDGCMWRRKKARRPRRPGQRRCPCRNGGLERPAFCSDVALLACIAPAREGIQTPREHACCRVMVYCSLPTASKAMK